jgi:hypothetical protein
MAVQFTRSGVVPTSEIATAHDPLDDFKSRVAECLEHFRSEPCTPPRFYALESELAAIATDACREILEREANRLEPKDKKDMPSKVRYHKERYRINKKTKLVVATRFGAITLWSFLYLNECDGEPGLHPLRLRLGIGGGATPALLERVARMSVDHTQAEVRAWLLREHGLKWSNDRLRAALAVYRQAIGPFVAELQKAKLLAWLTQAEKSCGRNRPVLAAGRDGIMVPLRTGNYHEASTATVSVYDRGRRRLGTVYLGQMPESKQTTLSNQLTALLKKVLLEYEGPTPRLAYITDKGSAPDEYYRKVLKKMKHPRRPTEKLEWQWVLDFYHVCSYIGKIADALFGAETKKSAAWFAKMRHWLRDRKHGAAHIARSAMQFLGNRKMTKAKRAEFWKAYRYLRKHRRWMDYEGYRRRGLPIGSGVTEAACKTVFTQRFKRSGMRWSVASGQVILDLRTAYLSGIWDDAFARDLATREMPEAIGPTRTDAKRGSCQGARRQSYQMAA